MGRKTLHRNIENVRAVSYTKPPPAGPKVPSLAEARHGTLLASWKAGFLAGWAAAAELAEALGAREQVMEALARTLRPMEEWVGDPTRAVPPAFEAVHIAALPCTERRKREQRAKAMAAARQHSASYTEGGQK
jgi:hypothetical protein